MLCIAVAPESRRLGKVDLFNAASQADLVEFRLDRLGKEPDIKELLEGISKPVLISCRRKEDGGAWDGSEEERLTLLRAAIVAGPAYIELEPDIAGKIPRFGKTKRVICFTSLDKPLANLDALILKAKSLNPDVIKFVGPTPTLEAAWPLLATISKKHEIPVVGMGLGPHGVMFSLLARKYGSPWIYASLEKGLEAHAGQSTVFDLDDIYGWREINAQTRFVAVTGFGSAEQTTIQVLNAGFKKLNLNFRCLPLEIGRTDKLGQMLDILHIGVVVGSPQTGERLLIMASNVEEAARISQYADLVVKQQDGWHAYNTIWRSVLRTVEARLGSKTPDDRPLDRRNVFIVGAGGAARGIGYGIQRRKGLISITAPDDNEARTLAQQFQARFVPFKNMYDTLCDVVLFTDTPLAEDADVAPGTKINPSFLREHMTVTDVTAPPCDTPMLREARVRGCKVIEPVDVYADQIVNLFKTITGQDLSGEFIRSALPPTSAGE